MFFFHHIIVSEIVPPPPPEPVLPSSGIENSYNFTVTAFTAEEVQHLWNLLVSLNFIALFRHVILILSM